MLKGLILAQGLRITTCDMLGRVAVVSRWPTLLIKPIVEREGDQTGVWVIVRQGLGEPLTLRRSGMYVWG